MQELRSEDEEMLLLGQQWELELGAAPLAQSSALSTLHGGSPSRCAVPTMGRLLALLS